jgi:hypothetical protein
MSTLQPATIEDLDKDFHDRCEALKQDAPNADVARIVSLHDAIVNRLYAKLILAGRAKD